MDAFFPKQFAVAVLNAVLSVSALAGVLCPPRWACLPMCHLALSFALAGVLCPPRWACLPICLPSGFVFHLGWGAVSASLGLSPNLSPIWLCLQLGWGAVSASLGLSPVLSPNLSRTWLCLSRWLGCCVRLAGLVSQFVSQFVSHLALSFTLAGVLCPPRWAWLPICLPVFSPHLFPICLCLSPWLGCCVRLAGLVSGLVFQFVSQFVCLPPGFVFYVGWGAVSASLGLSPNLSPNLSPAWLLGWGAVSASLGLSPNSPNSLRVRLAGLVSGLVCHLGWDAVSASLGCLRSCLQLVAHLVWDALSASLVLSFSCLWPCLPAFVFVLSRSLSFIWDAVSARPGLVFFLSLVLSPSLSPIWSGMLCPPPWSCLSLVSGLVSQLLSLFCLVACLSSGMLCLLALGLSFSCLPACLPSGLGCCVHLAGLVFLLSAVLSPALSAILAGVLCPPCWAVSGLVSQLVSHLVWDAVSASLVLSFSCLRSCLRSCLPPSWLGCCVRLSGLSPVLSPSLSPIWSGMLCPPPWSCLSLVQLVPLFCLVACLSSGMLCLPPVGLSFSCLWSCLPACLGC